MALILALHLQTSTLQYKYPDSILQIFLKQSPSITMQLQLLTLAFAALAAAVPRTQLEQRAPLCPSLDTPLCCQLDVDGVIDTSCESRMPSTLTSINSGNAN